MSSLTRALAAPAVPSATTACCLILLLLSTPLCLAQLPAAEGALEETIPSVGLPNFAARTVPGESVVDLADFASGYLADSGSLPDFLQLQTADGGLRRASAGEAFALLARTVHLWQTMGSLPSTVPLAPDEINAPLIDPQDVPSSDFDPDAGREIPTDQFLAQCGETVRWIDRLHTIPTAVWVDGQRLSAVDYFAGLAVCIQYAYWEGQLYDTIYIPAYLPPQSWIGRRLDRDGAASSSAAPQGGQPQPEVPYQETGQQESPQQPPLLPTFAPAALELPLPPAPEPQLALFPRSGSTLSDKADLVASYSGPPARFVLFSVDGVTRSITNFPPYSYRWDTSTLAPGPHTVGVQVLGEDDVILVDQLCGYIVAPPEREPTHQLMDDL